MCHIYFGQPRSNNDINLLKASHIFANLDECITPPTYYDIKKMFMASVII